MKRNAFEGLHLIVALSFFVLAILLSIITSNPAFQLANLVLSVAFFISLQRKDSLKILAGLFLIMIAITAINPLFNTQGNTVLFTWLQGRKYTLEALLYGASTAMMFGSVMLWFFGYTYAVPTDRLLSVLGKIIPSTALMITMALRLIPEQLQQLKRISEARRCIGLSTKASTIKLRIASGASNLSVLADQTFESSVTRVNSMKSRGYGYGKRTHAASSRLSKRDIISLCFVLLLLTVILIGLANGHMSATYFPIFELKGATSLGAISLLAYIAFFSLPLIFEITEELTWRYSISRI